MSEITTSPKKRNRGYIEGYKPHKKTLALIDTAKAVLDEYEDYWPLTRCGRSCARSRFYSWHAIPQHRKTKAITFTGWRGYRDRIRRRCRLSGGFGEAERLRIPGTFLGHGRSYTDRWLFTPAPKRKPHKVPVRLLRAGYRIEEPRPFCAVGLASSTGNLTVKTTLGHGNRLGMSTGQDFQ